MQQLIAAVLKSDMEAATDALLRVGVIDFIDVREIPADWTSQLERFPAAEDREKARELRLRLDAYFRTVGFIPQPSKQPSTGPEKRAPKGASEHHQEPRTEQSEPIDLSEAEKEIDKLGGEFRKIRDKQKEVQNEILRIQELRRQMPGNGEPSSGRGGRSGGAGRGGPGASQLAKGTHSYITVHTGVLPRENRNSFEKEIGKFPSVYLPRQGGGSKDLKSSKDSKEGEAEGASVDFLINLKRDDNRVEHLLEKYGWEERSYEGSGDDGKGETPLPIEELDAKLESFRYLGCHSGQGSGLGHLVPGVVKFCGLKHPGIRRQHAGRMGAGRVNPCLHPFRIRVAAGTCTQPIHRLIPLP